MLLYFGEYRTDCVYVLFSLLSECSYDDALCHPKCCTTATTAHFNRFNVMSLRGVDLTHYIIILMGFYLTIRNAPQSIYTNGCLLLGPIKYGCSVPILVEGIQNGACLPVIGLCTFVWNISEDINLLKKEVFETTLVKNFHKVQEIFAKIQFCGQRISRIKTEICAQEMAPNNPKKSSIKKKVKDY